MNKSTKANTDMIDLTIAIQHSHGKKIRNFIQFKRSFEPECKRLCSDILRNKPKLIFKKVFISKKKVQYIKEITVFLPCKVYETSVYLDIFIVVSAWMVL